MSDKERGNRLGAYWKEHPDGVETYSPRDNGALGNARPSRYGLSSPTNFPPVRSVRSPGGFHTEDSPDFYDNPRDARETPADRRGPARKTALPAPDAPPRARESRRGTETPDPAELERLYRIATGQKAPSFADALRKGPWTESVLRRRAFPLFLAECAVYAVCFWYLLDPLSVLTARAGFPLSAVLTAAGVSLAGTLICALFYPIFPERRILSAAWSWMLAASCLLLLLVQLLLWGEAQAQWTVIRFFCFFLLGPLAGSGILAYSLLFIHWRRSLPHPKKTRAKKETETEAEESGEDRRRNGRTQKAEPGRNRRNRTDRADRGRSSQDWDDRGRDNRGRDSRERDDRDRDDRDRDDRERDSGKRNPSALDRNGWNRNLSASSSGGWERGSGWERYAQSDRNRWRQTEAERDGRRQAESVRRKWK